MGFKGGGRVRAVRRDCVNGSRAIATTNTLFAGVRVERHEEAVGERRHEEQQAEHHKRKLVAAHLFKYHL